MSRNYGTGFGIVAIIIALFGLGFGVYPYIFPGDSDIDARTYGILNTYYDYVEGYTIITGGETKNITNIGILLNITEDGLSVYLHYEAFGYAQVGAYITFYFYLGEKINDVYIQIKTPDGSAESSVISLTHIIHNVSIGSYQINVEASQVGGATSTIYNSRLIVQTLIP
jgi:hypothetical protein